MSLVFSAITPHSPILLPKIGKGEEKKAKKTIKSLDELSDRISDLNPDIIIVLTPHGGLYEESFTVNAHDNFKTNFSDFGDLDTKENWKGAPEFAAKLAHVAVQHDIPVQLNSDEILGHGTSVPLHFIAKKIPNTKILPIGFSDLKIEDHIKFGEVLKDLVLESPKKIALIISGDLSHTLTETSPGGYHEDGRTFDETVVESLQHKHFDSILKINSSLAQNADQCMHKSLIIGLGVLKNMSHNFNLLSYEYPFGVGYLTGEFVF